MHILYKVQLRNCFAFLQKREKNSYKIGNSPKCTTLYKVQLRELFLQNAHMMQSAIERIFLKVHLDDLDLYVITFIALATSVLL